MAVVVFSYATWAARFPELASSVDSGLARLFFNDACLYLNNTDASIVQDIAERTSLLNLLTAHIAFLQGPQASGVVGRISQAQQGSVTVQSELALPNTAAWYSQSQYGVMYWTATAKYRTVRYARPPQCKGPVRLI